MAGNRKQYGRPDVLLEKDVRRGKRAERRGRWAGTGDVPAEPEQKATPQPTYEDLCAADERLQKLLTQRENLNRSIAKRRAQLRKQVDN